MTASFFPRSTWIGFELSILGKELTLANIQEEPVSVFVRSLPLRYYTILLIVFCNANILMLRDFGPMLLAEQRARQSAHQSVASESQQQPDVSNAASTADNAESPSNPDAALQLTANLANIDTAAASAAVQASPPNPAFWYFAAVPIAVMSVTMACGIVVDGRSKIMEQDPDRSISMMDILSATDTSKVLIWSTLLASVSAIALCVSLKRLCLEGAVEAWVEGIRVVVPGLLILIFSWSVGEMSAQIHVGAFLTSFLGSSVPPSIFPALVFVTGALISLATGSSWGTMSILFPMVVPVAAHMGGLVHGHPAAAAPDVVVAAVAAILTGSIFGDHCSPISDTTVFAAIASSCDLMSHVKTQMPYAITIALVSVACYLFTGFVSINIAPLVVLIGSVICCLIIRFAGTEVENFQFENGGRVREIKSWKTRVLDCFNRARGREMRERIADDSEMSLVGENCR
jgi:Na+/H+ antiporter NhaC